MKKSLVVLTVLALSACGNGGGTSSSMQLQSARAPAQPFFTTPTANLIGVNAYHMTYGESPNSGTVQFNGQVAQSSTTTLLVMNGNASVLAQTNTDYYLQNPYAPLGAEGNSSGTPYELIFNGTFQLPAVLTVDASGPLAAGTFYTPGTQNIIGSLSETYSVAPFDSTRLLLNISTTGSLNGTPISQVISYVVDAAGDVGLMQFELTLPPGTTIYFSWPAP